MLPRSLVEPCPRVLLNRGAHEIFKILTIPLTSAESGQRERRVEEAAVCQVVDSGQQLRARQIAGNAENDQAARRRNSGQPPIHGASYLHRRVIR